jgi:class 3 adenylate cyclase
MIPPHVLLVDSDEHSSVHLLEVLHKQGFPGATRVAGGLEVPQTASRMQPDLVLFNHHFDRPDDLLGCCAVRLAAPDAVIVALAAAGPTVRQVRHWATETRYVDAVLEKPLPEGQLRARLEELACGSQAARALRLKTQRIANLLPDGALAALEGDAAGQEEMFEAAVLFSDVRRSSEMITRTAPREYFGLLNASLSAQAALVRSWRGAVVKYTGDGMMAVFRGMGRSHLALRCAQELAAAAPQQALPFGIGVAEGLVLSGLVGASSDPSQRSQYDVIGATVHLAARLCGMAGAGEVVATRAAASASRLALPGARQHPALAVRGFPAPIECVAFQAQTAPSPA